jgi:hypothetical protein
MKNLVAIFVLVLLLYAVPSRADTVPDAAFANFYQNCMGGVAPAKDRARAEYCSCIRNKMRNWSPQQFEEMSAAMAKSKSPQATSGLKEMAKECMGKIPQ